MLRNRWQEARESARLKAISEKQPELANRIAQFQFRDIRPKAASEITDLGDASLLLGHSVYDDAARGVGVLDMSRPRLLLLVEVGLQSLF